MPSRKLLRLAIALLLAAPLPLAFPAPAEALPPFGIGDWQVTGAETLIDSGVILDGNLTVAAGGSLTLVNSTLQLLPGPHEVRVLAGGELRVLSGSSVGSFDTTEKDRYRAGFRVEEGARAEFRNSTFNAIGIIYRWAGSTMFGGVCVYTDNAVIDNCTFAGNYIGLTVFGDCDLTGCRFENNTRMGAATYGGSTAFSLCSFERNFYGVVAYRGSADFTECDFNDNAVGAAADSILARFTRCGFLRNVRTGLYVSPEQGLNPVPGASEVFVDDCLFEGNRWGINGTFFWTDEGGGIHPLEHNLYMTNSDFRDNTDNGFQWDRFIPDGNFRRSLSRWTVRGSSEVQNNTVHFKGNISVEGGLEVRSSMFKIDSEGPGWQDLTVREGGRLAFLENSTLMAATRDQFGLFCRPGSAFVLDRSVLRGCGWDAGVPSRAGPFIETADARISRSTIKWCPTALVFSGARGALVEDCALRGNLTDLGLAASTVTLQNCTLGAPSISQSRLAEGSLLDSINSTVERSRVEFGDNRSRVNISWHLDVRAVWSDGRPVPGARFCATDSRGALAVDTTLDAGGRAAGLVLQETTFTLAGSDELTPHHLTCARGPVLNGTDILMDASRRLELVLADSEPPSLSVTSPSPGSHERTRPVRLSGRAQDNLALSRVAVVLDGWRRNLVYQDAGGSQWQVDWNFTVELAEGYHTLEAEAVDTSGNRATRSFSFDLDVSPPKVLITWPPDGLLTGDPEVDVAGMAEARSEVSVNGVPARTAGGTFSARIRLFEGENLVTATATDEAGNQNRSSITVRLDTLPPALEVLFTPDAPAVRDPQVGIRGTMEFGAAVSVNGRRVVLPGLSGDFSTLFFLSPGNNTIRVEAVDAAGNVNTVERRFVLDTVPPAFQVLFPPDRLLTREETLEIMLVAEAGTDMTAGNLSRKVPGEAGRMVNWSLLVRLAEGQNDLRLICRDAAGNSFSASRLVTLDTTPPPLALSSPEDGAGLQKDSVYVVGETAPDAAVTVNGVGTEVGAGGSFSAELKLGAGRNRIVVQAVDPAGNVNETTLNVTRLPARGDTTVVGSAGPDWPFWGFLAAAAISVSGEGWWLWRRQSLRALHPSPFPLHTAQTATRGVR
jgi:hypothetical protein